jgi:hypothetical protein
MDDQRRVGRPPPEVRREFAGCRLESQVLIRTYELVVPVIRRRIFGDPPPLASTSAGGRDRAGLMAQGA